MRNKQKRERERHTHTHTHTKESQIAREHEARTLTNMRSRSTRDLPENPASRKSPAHYPGLEVLTSPAQDLRHPSPQNGNAQGEIVCSMFILIYITNFCIL
jgi:hypothetical protein